LCVFYYLYTYILIYLGKVKKRENAVFMRLEWDLKGNTYFMKGNTYFMKGNTYFMKGNTYFMKK